MFILAIFVLGLQSRTTLAEDQDWEQGAKLLTEDAKHFDVLGFSSAVSEGIAIVGAPTDIYQGPAYGAAYLFNIETGEQLFKLVPDDIADGDYFGRSVSISGTNAIIGAGGHDANGDSSSAAYVFDVTTGEQLFKLLPDDGEAWDHFGCSVSIFNDFAIIGADNVNDGIGAAYIFDITTGEQLFRFAPDYTGTDNYYFGSTVAISSNTAVIGAPYAAQGFGLVYVYDIYSGIEIYHLYSGDFVNWGDYASSVAISGDTVLVGAPGDDDYGYRAGAVYVFNAYTGEKLYKLTPDDAGVDMYFGRSVSIWGDTAIICASDDNINSENDAGSAYIFDTNTGEQLHKIVPIDGRQDDNFGFSVAIEENTAVIGVWHDDDAGANAGSAYVFHKVIDDPCLALTVDHLVAGQVAIVTISGGTPGAQCITSYGTEPGYTQVNSYLGYCATFDIDTNQSKIIGGFNQTFDSQGMITFYLSVPWNTKDMTLYFQSAEQGTCPGECILNLVTKVVQ